MKHLDLFSGIGGFALACKWNEIETIQFVEIDSFCQKVLRKNFPGVPIYDNIKTFQWDGRPVFLLTGGFPCQPFSVAGKRKGKEDGRALWPEMFRVIKEVKPRWIIGENVAGFINMGLDESISDLESEGYEVQTFIIPACAVNAPHRRDRVWIIGHNDEYGNEGKKQKIQNGQQSTITSRTSRISCYSERMGFDRKSWRRTGEKSQNGFMENKSSQYPTNNSQDDELFVADTNTKGSQKREMFGRDIQQEFSTSFRESWNENWFEVATRLCRISNGFSNRVDRLKSLGNAIVPQVAYEIIKAIKEVEKNFAKKT